MEIIYKDGDLLQTEADIIVHQVNCQGAMNSGVAKCIRTKWPEVYKHYRAYWDIETNYGSKPTSHLLGTVLPVSVEGGKREVMNLFAQNYYGYDGEKYTSYDALDTCLKKLSKYCKDNNKTVIALPSHLGCGRGGANWNVVHTMIEEAFKELYIKIEIWKL